MLREPLVTVRPKSRLEELPAEIIHEIFFRCLEISLPRASIYLGRVLSNHTLYTWLVRFAFVNAGSEKKRLFTQQFLPPYDSVSWIRDNELEELRTRILECRWCTLPLIRNCQLAYVDNILRYKEPELRVIPDDKHLLAGLAGWYDDLRSCDSAPTTQRGVGDLVLRANRPDRSKDGVDASNAKFSHDYNVAVWFNLGIIEISGTGHRPPPGDHYFELPYCEGTYLPDRLLCAPWTEEKLEFLQLLSSKALLDKDTGYDRATRTLRQLIRDRDFTTFARLLDLHVRIACYAYPVLWPTNNKVFRAALKRSDEHEDPFIRLLVEQRWGHIASDDPSLKQKLMKKMLNGVNRGFSTPNTIE